MTLEELEKIQDAICDTHKCGPNCPNRRQKLIIGTVALFAQLFTVTPVTKIG
jgi:hypothetical protein